MVPNVVVMTARGDVSAAAEAQRAKMMLASWTIKV
jgi:hypothetical protein